MCGYNAVVSLKDYRSGDEVKFGSIIEGLKQWSSQMGFAHECMMLRTLNPLYLSFLVSPENVAKLMAQLLEARKCLTEANVSFYYDSFDWARVADPVRGVRSLVTPVTDFSPAVEFSLDFMKRIHDISDFQEGFTITFAKYAIQVLADKMGCTTPGDFTHGCQSLVEEEWQKHLTVDVGPKLSHEGYSLQQVLSGMRSHIRKLMFCARENKLLSCAAALPLEKSYLRRNEVKEKQRRRLQSETQVTGGRWRRRAVPEEKSPACSGDGLAGGSSKDAAPEDSLSVVPVWKTIEVPNPPGELWDWTTPWVVAQAFSPWLSDELVPGVRCDKSRKESLFLCAQQMLRKKFDVYKMPIDKEGAVLFTDFCDVFLYAQEHFASSAKELAGIILTNPKQQFNIFVLEGELYRVGCIAGHDQMLDLRLPRAEVGTENKLGCLKHKGTLGDIMSVCKKGFVPGGMVPAGTGAGEVYFTNHALNSPEAAKSLGITLDAEVTYYLGDQAVYERIAENYYNQNQFPINRIRLRAILLSRRLCPADLIAVIEIGH